LDGKLWFKDAFYEIQLGYFFFDLELQQKFDPITLDWFLPIPLYLLLPPALID
jgi:hypothetical protein